jgi:uncharacterized LabA/DUF88 family protein
MMVSIGSYDTAVLVSGDGDPAYAAGCSHRGVRRVEVEHLRLNDLGDHLINVADRYVDLEVN